MSEYIETVNALPYLKFVDRFERKLPVGPSARASMEYLQETAALIQRQIRELELLAEYQFHVIDADGETIDRAGNVESTVSILYGDLSTRDGRPWKVVCPAEFVDLLKTEARSNADCWGIPVDIIEPAREFVVMYASAGCIPDSEPIAFRTLREAAQHVQDEFAEVLDAEGMADTGIWLNLDDIVRDLSVQDPRPNSLYSWEIVQVES